jgi:YidC/Oxa1 family membrane protein insertase
MLDRAAHGETRGVLTEEQVTSLANAEIFGAKISATFMDSGGDIAVQILAGVLVLAMTATTFLTQRQLMTKNMPPDAMKGQYAQQQKMLLYILPIVFAVGGIAFPIGVIIYWTTSNLWTMGQQFYVIRNNPAPGTPAFAAKEKRDAEKKRRKGGGSDGDAGDSGNGATPAPTAPAAPTATAVRRQQPKKQSREQRKKGKGAPPRSPGSSSG